MVREADRSLARFGPQIIEEISPRSKDIIIGAGERLSCRIVVGALRNAGVNAELVTLENIVEQAMVDGAPAGAGADKGEGSLDQAFYDNIAAKLGERLNSCKGVPVVTGKLEEVEAH